MFYSSRKQTFNRTIQRINELNKKYNEDVLEILKPAYPWKKEILDTYKIQLSEIELIKKENEELHKENNNNRNIIKNLIKELENYKKSSKD